MKGVDLASKYYLCRRVSKPQSGGAGLGTLDKLGLRVKLVKDSLTTYIKKGGD